MPKTLSSLIDEARMKWDLWDEISKDEVALTDRGKTREEALMLVNYFEGRFDALCDARIVSRDLEPDYSIKAPEIVWVG